MHTLDMHIYQNFFLFFLSMFSRFMKEMNYDRERNSQASLCVWELQATTAVNKDTPLSVLRRQPWNWSSPE